MMEGAQCAEHDWLTLGPGVDRLLVQRDFRYRICPKCAGQVAMVL